jgi:hypothetical protein
MWCERLQLLRLPERRTVVSREQEANEEDDTHKDSGVDR